jgi:hypothetical protein
MILVFETTVRSVPAITIPETKKDWIFLGNLGSVFGNDLDSLAIKSLDSKQKSPGSATDVVVVYSPANAARSSVVLARGPPSSSLLESANNRSGMESPESKPDLPALSCQPASSRKCASDRNGLTSESVEMTASSCPRVNRLVKSMSASMTKPKQTSSFAT